MKAMRSLVVAALAAAGLAVTVNVQAAGTHGGGGSHGHWSGGHFSGGHRFFSGPRVGFFIGAPVLFGSWYWGYPYDYYYPYYPYYPRDVVVDPAAGYAAPYPDGVMQPPPTTEVPRTEGGPAQAPAYMNYCQSANAYFPKVTTCPEGWKFVPSR